jgi:DNA-directed RNA polymerase subunit L
MLAEIIHFEENELELKLEEEDISVMYIIQHELLKEKNVEFAGVMLKHPLVRDYVVRILTKKKDPIDAFHDAASFASEYVKELSSTLKSALKKQQE